VSIPRDWPNRRDGTGPKTYFIIFAVGNHSLQRVGECGSSLRDITKQMFPVLRLIPYAR
jgi:hypothetical protein